MANLPNNSTYSSQGGAPNTSTYRPSLTYSNLAEMKRQGGSPFSPQQLAPTGTPEYYQGLKNSLKTIEGQAAHVPTMTPFEPPLNGPHLPTPIPSDYNFTPAGGVPNTNYQWSNPVSPQIFNLPGDVLGQYVGDTSNPNALIKSARSDSTLENRAFLDGRPSFQYQSDHIIPLSLGGADTAANKELLTMDQNDKKTKAQAVPYTLYSHGDINLHEARVMAMQWQNRDLTDIPQPDEIGLVPLDKARQAAQTWAQPPKPKFKNILAALPQAAKDFGAGFLPDSAREFIKGFTSQATFGFVPYQQGENETPVDKWAGFAGQITGGVASFVLGGALIRGGAAVIGLSQSALGLLRGKAAIEAAKVGFGTAEEVTQVANWVKNPTMIQRLGLPITESGREVTYLKGLANAQKTTATTFKSLNIPPTYLQKLLTPANIRTAGKFGAMNVVVGEANRLVSHNFTPDILTGKEQASQIDNHIAHIFGDLAIGSIAGIASPTLAGAALAGGLPTMIYYISDPEHPQEAIINGVVFGAMHMMGAPAKKAQIKAMTDSFEETANQAAYASLSHYAPDVLPELKSGEIVPITAKTFNTATNVKMRAVDNIWRRYFFDQNPDGTTAEGGMSLKSALTEVKRVTASARQLYKGGLSAEMRGKADIDDWLSFGKMAKSSKSNLENRFNSMNDFADPKIAQQTADAFDESMMTKSFNDGKKETPSGKYLNGDLALTGAGLDANTAEAKYYFEQKALGNASPNIILIDRPDSAPLWRMKNDFKSKYYAADIKEGLYGIDPNPEHALQAFGVVKNPITGNKELVPLGWVASNFRLNEGEYGINKHPAVKEYTETNGLKGFRPVDFSKDQVAPKMRQEGIHILIANLDPRATVETIESRAKLGGKGKGKPFIPLNINDQNWTYSKMLNDRFAADGNKSSLQMNIAKVNSALGAKGVSEAITNINKQTTKPPSEFIPKPPVTATISPEARAADTIAIPREASRSLLETTQVALSSNSPAELKIAFQKQLGIILNDKQAQDIYLRRNDLKVKDEIQILLDAVNSGNANDITKVRVAFMKQYLESDTFKSNEIARIFPELNATGGLKEEISNRPISNDTRVSPSVIPPEVVVPVDKSVQVVTPKIPSVTPVAPETVSVSTPSVSKDINPKTSETLSDSGLADRISVSATRELPMIKSQQPLFNIPSYKVTPKPTSNPLSEMANTFVTEGKVMMDESTGNSMHDTIVSRVLKMTQSALQKSNMSQKQIDEVKTQVSKELERHSKSSSFEDSQRLLVSETNKKKTIFNRFSKATETNPNPPEDKILQEQIDNLKPEEVQRYFIEDPGLSKLLPGDTFPTKESIAQPIVAAKEFYRFIDTGLKANSSTPQHFTAKTWDAVLKHLFGDKYKNNIDAARFLSTKSAEGSNFWNKNFFNDVNSAGKEIKQSKDILNARAAGDEGALGKAYAIRREDLKQNTTSEGGGLNEADKAKLGIGPKEMVEGMNVSPSFQEENMIGNLTKGEDMMAGISSELPVSAKTAVGDVKRIFLGTGKDNPGLLKSINNYLVSTGKKKKGIPSTLFSKIEKIAIEADKSSTVKANAIKEAETELKPLEKQYANITKIIETHGADPVYEQIAEDIKAKMIRFSKIIEDMDNNSVSDGSGGPGLLTTAWNTIKNPPLGIMNANPTFKGYGFKPLSPIQPKPISYNIRGLNINDSDISEAANILYGEISNRTPEYQRSEIGNIVNTALNRMGSNPGKTLTQVFQQPYQYQSYAPKGITTKNGVIESQYQKVKRGDIDELGQRKLQTIKDTLAQLKTGKFEDNTKGAQFYVHASDGSLFVGQTVKEAKALARKHETRRGIRKTQYGTAIGLPSGLDIAKR